ncbi:unnamed protein product [Symbiodinium natans]|uniref:ATP-dependent DNA helicase PIF1 n=1 Tax=Symbiodinium natans TaxID=878477 RepID=A0A812UEF4_9DINO|nr:unnamed protein product [Symbiodinium natans]
MPRTCPGVLDAPCRFSTSQAGEPAQPTRGHGACSFCDLERLEEAVTTSGVSNVIRMLRVLRGFDPDIYDEALARVGEVTPDMADIHNLVVSGDGAARTRGTQTWCRGQADHPCCFAADGQGGRAQGKRSFRCVFCDAGSMEQTIRTPQGRGNVVRLLKKWRATAPAVYEAALRRSVLAFLPPETRTALIEPSRQPSKPDKDTVLSWRTSVLAPPTPTEVEDFKALQNRVQDLAPNDTGLPSACASSSAVALEAACSRVPAAVIQRCKNCKKNKSKQIWVPWPEEVPEPLRGLSREIILALRPLEVDCGPEWKADYGYFFHSTMLRLAWSAQDVEAKIAGLDGAARRTAAKAFEFLMRSDDSSYRDFVRRRRAFMQRYPEADHDRRKRPLRCIEEAAVECVLWPHLYWDRRLCETAARLADVRRAARRQSAEPDDDGWSEDQAGEEEDVDPARRQSLKRNFLAKALGPIADYAGEYELLHFVFDLSTWSDVGGKKGALRGTPMWQAMKGAPWTPQYWKVRHAAALDMQAQCSHPVAFLTWAPFEWSAPYHEWLLRQMAQLGRQRLQLAGPETMHLAHILTELFREWVCGGGRKSGDASSTWRSALLGGVMENGRRLKVNFIGHLEFQDGKGKEVTQSYHGRAAVHLHGLVFADSLAPVRLPDKASATVPEEGNPLRGYVLDGQAGRTGSGWPQHSGNNEYDAVQDKVRLRHTELDKKLGIRGYIPEVLDVLKCHQDLQLDRGSGLMLKYTATYLPKFGDGPGKELMDDASSGYGAARRVLFTFHPGEPEMWLLLANQTFPMFFMGGTMQPIIAPHPGMPVKPEYLQLYEAADWRCDMPLIEYLRRVNKKGAILEHIRKAYLQTDQRVPLQDFAVRFETFGERIIAAEMVSMQNDKFYGQWMALRIPYKRLEDLLLPEIVQSVPDQVKFLACALHWAPELWRSAPRVREYMALRAHRDAYIETVDDHCQHAVAVPRSIADLFEERLDDLVFAAEQATFERNVNQRVDQALRLREVEDEQEYERLAGIIEEHGSRVACSGAPGTGKTAVLDRCIRRAQQRGARVLIALPTATGVQRARVKQRHPDAELDTCHGAFLFHKPLAEAMGIMSCYDLIVIDEAPQLFEERFDRLDEMWMAAGKAPCLVFAGDEWQLPPPDHTKRSLVRHPKWNLVRKIELHHIWRQHEDDLLQSKLTFLRKNRPTGTEGSTFVRDLCRNHKAWSGHHRPRAEDIQALMERTAGDTTVITCTRRGAALVNALAQEVLFKRAGQPALGRVAADWESNPANYDEDTGVLLDRCPAHDFVNGMAATVLSFDPRYSALIVETETSETLCVYPVSDDNVPDGHVTYHPVRLGYADTVHKFQGAELRHVTFWPDCPGCPAAGYVALSRVRRDCDYLLGGCVAAEHFVPAM